MDLAFQSARVLSIAAFLFYGVHCLRSPAMVAEFERYGLARLRTLTGTLEVLGALGLLAGYAFPSLTAFSAGGLTLLMLLGILTRLRIRDPLVAMLPAFVLFVVNGFVFVQALRQSTGP